MGGPLGSEALFRGFLKAGELDFRRVGVSSGLSGGYIGCFDDPKPRNRAPSRGIIATMAHGSTAYAAKRQIPDDSIFRQRGLAAS